MKLFIVLIGLMFFNACIKQDCLREFEFHFPATITQGDTFTIGDTIWMEMSLPNELIDHQTGELIDLSDFDLYFGFGIEKIDTMYVNNAIDDFELIEQVGRYSQKRGRFIVTYVHFENRLDRRILVGFVPKKKGAFLMALSLPLEYGLAELADNAEDRLKIINSPCTYQDITHYSGVRFNNGAVNYSLIRAYPCSVTSPTDTLTVCTDDSTTLARRGGFVFAVD
jgi:hypothetical protein